MKRKIDVILTVFEQRLTISPNFDHLRKIYWVEILWSGLVDVGTSLAEELLK